MLTTGLLLFYPYGANYGEAPILSQAINLISGHNIYKPSVQTPPYVIANYTPLYPWLVGVFHSLLHLPLFLTGRALSILAGIASSILLGSTSRKLFHSNPAGYIAAAFFLGHPYVSLWSGLVRVDGVALALSLAGLWIVCFHWRSYPWLVTAIACLLAAVYTRQTYLLAAPLASTVWLLHNDQKRGIAFIAIFTLLGSVTFLALNTATQGGFYYHIIISNVNHYSIGRMLSMGTLFLICAPILVILSVFAIRKAAQHAADPFLIWGLLPYTIGAFFTALTVGKIGSDINYFLELIAALAIWAAGIWKVKPGRPASILLGLHTLWMVAFSLLLFQIPLVKLWDRLPELDSLAQQVKTAASQGPVLADDRLDLVVLAGQEIYYQPFEYTQLYNAGIWDINPFEKDIADHKFPLILIHTTYRQERWPSPVFNVIQQNYACALQTGILVCRP